MKIGVVFFFQAEDGIRDLVRSRGLGDVYKRQLWTTVLVPNEHPIFWQNGRISAEHAPHERSRNEAVSYTHLTLPTSDLV